MAYDIHGNDLEPGFCEVHPCVRQEYPCNQCIMDRQVEPTRPEPTGPDYRDVRIAQLESELATLRADHEWLLDNYASIVADRRSEGDAVYWVSGSADLTSHATPRGAIRAAIDSAREE